MSKLQALSKSLCLSVSSSFKPLFSFKSPSSLKPPSNHFKEQALFQGHSHYSSPSRHAAHFQLAGSNAETLAPGRLLIQSGYKTPCDPPKYSHTCHLRATLSGPILVFSTAEGRPVRLLLLSAIVLQTAIICTAVSNFKQQPFSHDSRTKILNSRVDAAISSILKDFKTPGGVAVAVVQKSQDSGWRVETKGYGLAKVDGTRVIDDTLFAIGSNSNFEGRHFPYLQRPPAPDLQRNPVASDFLKHQTRLCYPRMGADGSRSVIRDHHTGRQSMSHRTGLPRHDRILPTGTVSDTNNLLYTLLSDLPSLLTGIPFEIYVNDFILQRLGMNSTTYFSKTAADSGNLADGLGRGVTQTEDVFGLGQVRVQAYPFWAPNEGNPGSGIHALQFPELSPLVYGGGQMRGTYRGLVLSNDETFGIHIAEAVKYRIIDEVLNLERIDWSASALAGTYRDPGYGVLDLCFVSPKSLVTLASESCRQLIDEIPTTLPAVLDPRIPTLLARWNGSEVTHAAFAHFEQNLFNVTAVLSVSTGNSSDKPYWVQIETDPSFVAEFSFEDKVGLQGLWGAGRGIGGPQGDSVRDRAEV
ncbi:hypothetical protein B0H14DRAFT_3736395 [Mycena olivaceomarginata]|nr:hypothetical protein B0H14DRAFT_3736395 [Mycena olivaceomarginata]